jgi:hypothetical protein
MFALNMMRNVTAGSVTARTWARAQPVAWQSTVAVQQPTPDKLFSSIDIELR